MDDADILPENTTSWLSYCTFQWMTPLLATGYARPIVAEDLYDLGHERAAEMFAERITQSFEKRELVAKAFNHRLDMDEVAPPLFKSFWWSITGQKKVKLAQWATNARKEPSLAMACNDAVFFWFWTGGFFRLLADVGTILSPLILKVALFSNFHRTLYLSSIVFRPLSISQPLLKMMSLTVPEFLLLGQASVFV